DDGRVPPDFHIAIGSVGAIPYYSGLPTLDRTGLTDKHVARSEFIDRKGWVAHGKSATLDYARRAGVDFWSLGVHVCWNVADPKFVSVFPGADAVADVGDGYYLLGRFPQGFAAAAARLPALSLEHPSPTTMYRIAQALRTKHQPQTALPLFESALRGAKQLLPEGDQLRSIMRAAYGACLVELERYEEAELQLAAAYAMMQQSPTRSDAVVRRLLTELIAVYDKLGRDDEAERYRQSLHQVDD
ncbi:MAG: tetratricopeptide repeat protein, partial [Phycisphaerae bacterium]